MIWPDDYDNYEVDEGEEYASFYRQYQPWHEVNYRKAIIPKDLGKCLIDQGIFLGSIMSHIQFLTNRCKEAEAALAKYEPDYDPKTTIRSRPIALDHRRTAQTQQTTQPL